jgi:tetratricopeptide (TPR) repeat protein
MKLTQQRLVAAAALAAAGLAAGCTGREAAVPPGKMPITTSSKAALKEFLIGRDLNEKLRGNEARAHFQRAVELDPKFALAHLWVFHTTDGATQRFAAFRKAMELVDTVSEAEANVIRSVDAAVNSRPDEQRRLLAANVAAYPDDERAHSMLGNYFFSTQEWEAAIAEYRRAIAIDPKFSPPYNQLGYALRFLGRGGEAEAAFKTYAGLIPDEPNPYDSYAELLLHLGRYREAIDWYQKALDLNPNFPSAYVGIGHALIYMGQLEEARKAFVKLRYISRDDAERRLAALWLAASYLFEGDHDRAVAEIDTRLAAAKEKGDAAALSSDLELIGEILLDARRADEAAARFAEALALLDATDLPSAIKESGRVDYLFDMARVEAARGNLAGAAELAERYGARVQERRVPEEGRMAHALDGLIALLRGDAATAVKELQQANRNDPRVLLHLARALAEAGETAKAIEACRAAIVFNRPDLANAFAYRPARELLAVLMAKAAAQPQAR